MARDGTAVRNKKRKEIFDLIRNKQAEDKRASDEVLKNRNIRVVTFREREIGSGGERRKAKNTVELGGQLL